MTTTPDSEQTPQGQPTPEQHIQPAQPVAQSTHQAQPMQTSQPAAPGQPVPPVQPYGQQITQPVPPSYPAGHAGQAPQYSAPQPPAPAYYPETAQQPDSSAFAETTELPESAPQSHAAHYQGQAFGVAGGEYTTGVVTDNKTKSRAGVLFAGIAIGAIVGGIIGGGSAALVTANQGATSVVQSQTSGRVTLNNLETATSVSGVAAAAVPSVVTLEVTGQNAAGSGSGVIYSSDGYIVTNAHVVTLDGEAGSNAEIRVWLSDGRILDGTLVGTDPFADLAVVKVDADDLQAIELSESSEINVGDLAVAIGAPLNLSNTVTSGVVSALNRGISVGSPIIPDEGDDELSAPDNGGDSGGDNGSDEFPWYRFGDPNQEEQQQEQSTSSSTTVTLPVVQTDASINPGNSGGALLNANAELIGINVAIAANGSDSTTAGSDGLGFAIPVDLVKRVADALIAGEQPSHGLLGISVADSTSDTDADRNYAGGLISELVSGGAAEQGGLKVGDVITAVDGIPVDSGTTASALIRMHAGGDKVTITYTRGGTPGETEVTLGTLEW